MNTLPLISISKGFTNERCRNAHSPSKAETSCNADAIGASEADGQVTKSFVEGFPAGHSEFAGRVSSIDFSGDTVEQGIL